MAHILKLDQFSCSESVIFEACMSWIKAKSKQTEITKQLIQEHLGELFYDFRFTLMTINEFRALFSAYEHAFSLAEYKDIMQTLAKASPTILNKNPRQKVWNEHEIIVCDRKVDGISSNSAYPAPTTFESNQPILMGTLIFSPVKNSKCFEVKITETAKLSDSAKAPVLTVSKFVINLSSKKESSITLPTLVFVRPGFYYKIELEDTTGKNSVALLWPCLLREVKLQNNLNIKFHGNDSWDGDIHDYGNIITGFGFNRI